MARIKVRGMVLEDFLFFLSFDNLAVLTKVFSIWGLLLLTVLIWRRSYDVPPPTVDKSSEHHPANDPRYDGFDFPDEFTESLATTLDRVVPFWNEEIVPQIKDGKTVLIAAHGNSLRALVKHLDGIDEGTIAELNIPTGE